MRIFMTRAFERFARKERLGDRVLRETIERAERGIVNADLGGHVIKQRVARQGEGRSGGYRTVIAFRSHVRAVFLFGFAKNELANIDAAELKALRKAATEVLSWSDKDVSALLEGGKWTEIKTDGQGLQK